MDRIHFNLTEHKNRSMSASVLAADTATVHLIAIETRTGPGGNVVGVNTGNAVSIPQDLFIQKIAVMVTTDAAKTMTFQDTAGTPVVVAVVKSSPGIGPIVFDFGPDGYKCTTGKGLDMVLSGAGLAATVTVTAYQKDAATAL